MITVQKGMSRPEASVTVVYGPNGAGKTHAINMWSEQGPPFVLLSGTNMQQWFKDHGDILPLYGITRDRIPKDNDVLAKMKLVNEAALRLGRSGMDVVIDGHPAYKTAINLAARLTIAKSLSVINATREFRFGSPIAHQVAYPPLSEHFDALSQPWDVSVAHVEVTMPPKIRADRAGRTLQRRIAPRRTAWDPADRYESQAQMAAAAGLTKVLQQRGADVMSIWTCPNGIERFARES